MVAQMIAASIFYVRRYFNCRMCFMYQFLNDFINWRMSTASLVSHGDDLNHWLLTDAFQICLMLRFFVT